MRIVVGVEHAHQELAIHLLEIPPRQRAERLRVLATIGLLLARGAPDHPATAPDELTTTRPGIASARSELKQRLLRSSSNENGETGHH